MSSSVEIVVNSTNVQDSDDETYPYEATIAYTQLYHCVSRSGRDNGRKPQNRVAKYVYGKKTQRWKRKEER